MPRAPKQCGRPDCPERVPGGVTYCQTHQREYREQSSWGRGSTRRSRGERAEVLHRWPACYLHYPGCIGASTEDDHLIPLWRGGSGDLGNRRGACRHCHKIKSAREAAEARAARR